MRASSVLKHWIQSAIQRALIVLADRSNYFIAAGMYGEQRFAHRRFMQHVPWWVSVDVARYATVELLAREIYANNVPGAVAELGVSQGGFAVILSRNFTDRKLYLFDTFGQAWDERDVAADVSLGFPANPYLIPPTSAAAVLARLTHPARAVICQGWFPESAVGHEDEQFCLVNIDVGLFQATYTALSWFYTRLAVGGYLLVTDYGNSRSPGVRAAVRQFAHEQHLAFTPLTDRGGTAVFAKPDASDSLPASPAVAVEPSDRGGP